MGLSFQARSQLQPADIIPIVVFSRRNGPAKANPLSGESRLRVVKAAMKMIAHHRIAQDIDSHPGQKLHALPDEFSPMFIIDPGERFASTKNARRTHRFTQCTT